MVRVCLGKRPNKASNFKLRTKNERQDGNLNEPLKTLVKVFVFFVVLMHGINIDYY
jgi:hypothetical protein